MESAEHTTSVTQGCTRPEGELMVEVKGLEISFGKKEVLKKMNLWLKKGENLVVFGKSGSGKSVLIKCLVGLLEPDKGSIEVIKRDILSMEEKELNKLRKKIGFLFQGAALYDSMTVRENLEFPLRDSGEKSDEGITEKIESVLKNVGLSEAIDKMPSELSGGMRKRIALARTLILNPEIMLYDEPTTGLDPVTSREISKLILDVQKKYNTSSIIITHDVACAKITANRMIFLRDGMCYAEGTFEEMERSDDEWVRSFFE
ncbi:MAG: ABC transporter ATP-binding protein [Bacteroidia bacterium]